VSGFYGSGAELSYARGIDAHCPSCYLSGGHQRAHPELTCADVGCPGGHPQPPRVAGQWTAVCADGEHERCAGFVGSARTSCTCRCHPEHVTVAARAREVVALALAVGGYGSDRPRSRGDMNATATEVVHELNRLGLLREGISLDR
jgi:hypothetical protein